MGDVRQFPTKPLSAADLAEFRATLTAKPLTRDQIANGPIDLIDQPGPYVADPDGPLSDELCRLRAIVAALLGPGRVQLADGVYVCAQILERIAARSEAHTSELQS